MTDDHEISELVPTPDTVPRRSSVELWDESARPSPLTSPAARTFSARGRAAAAGLKEIHNRLRAELLQVLELIEQVAKVL